MSDETARQTAEQDADPRVDLAIQRTELAEHRTLLAWVRTSMALIGTGVAFNKGVQFLHQSRLAAGTAFGPDRSRDGAIPHHPQHPAAGLCSRCVSQESSAAFAHKGRRSTVASALLILNQSSQDQQRGQAQTQRFQNSHRGAGGRFRR